MAAFYVEGKTIYQGLLSYRFPQSQGKVIAMTKDCPDRFPDNSWYTDHLRRHARDRHEACSEVMGTGEGHWAELLRKSCYASGKKKYKLLLAFGQAFAGLDHLPEHVRVRYNFNVATGYDILYVEVWDHGWEERAAVKLKREEEMLAKRAQRKAEIEAQEARHEQELRILRAESFSDWDN